MKKSIWDLSISKFPSLDTDCQCDICIVGGGLTGVSLAYYLRNTSHNIVLIEQNRLGCSTTVRSTAKLTYLQQDLLSKIRQFNGKEKAFQYYLAQKQVIQEIVNIIKDEKIECHLEKSPSYLFVQENKNIPKLKKEFNLYKDFKAPIKWMESLPIYCGEVACCSVDDTYVFHPLEYLRGLVEAIQKEKNKIQIYEQTRMVQYQKNKDSYTITLQNGHTIHTKKLVFAGHYPPFVFPYLFPAKTYLEKEFVDVQSSKNMHFNAINLDQNIHSIRFYENQMIRVFHSKQLGNQAISKSPIPDGKVKKSWNNYDIMTPSSLPIVGWVGNSQNGLYIGTGFNAWGVTNSNLAAQILAFELQEKKHPYKDLCNPYSCSIPIIWQKLVNIFSNVIHFVASYLPNKTTAQIVWKNGHRVGIVTDSKGIRHEVHLTCPHMGCGIRYNPKDETWDCPCHGSRFDLDGNLLRGPATDCIHSNDQ